VASTAFKLAAFALAGWVSAWDLLSRPP
jgi:hypothetical protein